jgi:hypothetical protein
MLGSLALTKQKEKSE